jgi:hypothetical protein
MPYNMTETTVASLHDNTPSVFWQRRDSTTHTGPAASTAQIISTHDYIPGHLNEMADYAPRSFDHTPNDFLTYFNSVFLSALSLDRMHSQVRNDFLSALGTVQEAINAGVATSRATKTANTWKLWLEFCDTHKIDLWFSTNLVSSPHLQIFGQRLRDYRFPPSNKSVRASTVADAIRMV